MAEINGSGGISSAYPVCDGSWNLRILVTDLQVERTLRVKGELHVGGAMLKLVDELGRTRRGQPTENRAAAATF